MRRFFNEKADGYDEVHGQKHLFDTKIALVERVPKDARCFLDLGVGTGLELTLLFEKLPDADVTGIDISENMLAELGKLPFADRIKAVCGDFFDVDFGSGYDCVITSSALHHFEREDKLRLYKKVYAALKEGGFFISSDCIYSTLDEEKWTFEHYGELIAQYRHVDTPLAAETEITLLSEAGFGKITITDLENEKYKLIYAQKM